MALSLLLSACPSEPAGNIVRVDLKTDYAPFVEFDAVRMQVGESDVSFRVDRVVAAGEDYLRGQRIDETTVQPGEHPITITLFQAGTVIATRRVAAVVQSPITIVTVVLTRDCEGVTCPNDNPAFESCLGGRCVDPRCTPETPEFCPVAQCTSDGECGVADVTCAESRCDEGVCLTVPNDSLCSAGDVCHGTRGCITRVPRDAGVDGGPDASVFDGGGPDVFDGGPADVGISDVFDAGPPDVFDAGPPGACDPADGDSLFLFTFDDALDMVTGMVGIAEGSELRAGGSPCGGNVLGITNDPAPSHFRIPNRPEFELATGSLDFYANMPPTPAGSTRDVIGRDASGTNDGHFTVSMTPSDELVVRIQALPDRETYICSNPIPAGWHRVGVNFGNEGLELWVDGMRHNRPGMVQVRGGMVPCNSGVVTANLVGNQNLFVIGSVQIYSDEGSLRPLSDPYPGLEMDHLRLSRVRRNYASEIRP